MRNAAVLLLVVPLLLGCKRRERQAESRLLPSAAVPTAASAGDVPRSVQIHTEVPELAEQLGAIIRAPSEHSTGKDSGPKTVTFHLKPLDGIELATFVGVRGQEKAWRFGLEGVACQRVHDLGLEVVELRRGGGRPLSARWYRVKGGPLTQLLVKVFPGDGPGLCNVLPGTEPYWKHQGEQTP